MRLAVAVLGSALLLAGCENAIDTAPAAVTVELPANSPDQGAAAAATQCKAYGRTAKFKDVEPRGTAQVAVYDCV